MIDNKKEYVLCAAVKRKTPRQVSSNPYYEGQNDILDIEIGYRHHDIYTRFAKEDCLTEDMGFYTSTGRYVDRFEAMEIAYNAGQVSEMIAKRKPEIKINFIGETTDDMIIDDKKFNPLISEDLY